MQGKLPRKVYVACSGGVDSMAVVDFLARNHDVTALFFDHGTETSANAKTFLTKYLGKKRVRLVVGSIKNVRDKTLSKEEFWRIERYAFLNSFNDAPVITCHHLDDCVETWLWSCLNGEGKLIPFQNENIIRPFRLNRKQVFIDWCNNKHVKWIEDESNVDLRHIRNYIRHELIPKALVVNPGLHKVVMKKVKNDPQVCSLSGCADGDCSGSECQNDLLPATSVR